jgi:hypothetical protein
MLLICVIALPQDEQGHLRNWETIESVTLPMAAPKKVAAKKLASLKSKYFSIPEKHMHYYPDTSGVVSDEEGSAAAAKEPTPKKKETTKRKKAQGVVPPKRPKKYDTKATAGCRSILHFMKPALAVAPANK